MPESDYEPIGLRLLTDAEYQLRMARAIYNVSSRSDKTLIRGWDTLSVEKQKTFLDLAAHCCDTIEALRILRARGDERAARAI